MLFAAVAISQVSARLITRRLLRGQRAPSFLQSQRTALPFFFGIIWYLIYNFRVVETPVVRFQRSFWNVHIVERSRLLKLQFRPIFWAYNRHAQTVVCFVLSFIECIFSHFRYERETIPGFDSKPQFIDWAIPRSHMTEEVDAYYSASLDRVDKGLRNRSPVVILIHGLGDDRHIPYVHRMCRACHSHGWRAAVWSYWRCDFSESRDLAAVVNHIQACNPEAPIAAIGFSAGGHLLMRYLADSGTRAPLACAVTVSGCFDFAQAFKDVCENENPSYKIFLDLQQRKVVRRHLANGESSKQTTAAIEEALRTKTGIGLYDAVMTAVRPDRDIRSDDADRYSLRGHIGRVRVCTLVLHACDDPVVSNDHIDWAAIAANKHIIAAHTRRGGHVSFFDGWAPGGPTWADRACANFISAVLESHSQTNFMVNAVRKSLADNPDASEAIVAPSQMSRISSYACVQGQLVDFAGTSR